MLLSIVVVLLWMFLRWVVVELRRVVDVVVGLIWVVYIEYCCCDVHVVVELG